MGPDEFHEKYPGGGEGGLRNNAYTNVMVAWICATAPSGPRPFPARRAKALRSGIELTDDEVATWAEMSRKMFVPFQGDGIISQFEGYEELAELDWDAYRERYDGKIQRLDRILRAEGDDPDRYKMAKQADTVMLFFLFSEEELGELFERLGYELDPTPCAGTSSTTTPAPLTARRSATSPRRRARPDGPESSWERFLVALESDIGDIQGGTTRRASTWG